MLLGFLRISIILGLGIYSNLLTLFFGGFVIVIIKDYLNIVFRGWVLFYFGNGSWGFKLVKLYQLLYLLKYLYQ